MPKNRSIKVCHVNIRSLCAPSHLLDLEILPTSHSTCIDVLCLCETWLSSSKASSTVSIPSFQPPIRCDRSGCRGGGVAIFVKSGLAVQIRSLLPTFSFEYLCADIHVNKRGKNTVIVIYQPPGRVTESFESELDYVLNLAQGQSQAPICVVGNFNARVSD